MSVDQIKTTSALLLLTLALSAPKAFGQVSPGPCAQRSEIVTTLTDRYGETVRGMGLANSNAIVEVYVSGDTGTWTITLTRPDGITCLVAAGQAFEDIAPMPVGAPL